MGFEGKVVIVTGGASGIGRATALTAAAVDGFGGLDVAVNNAGILGNFVPAADIPLAEFDRIMAVNVRGVFLGMKHQVRAMLADGGGSIVNVRSAAGVLVQPFAAAYSASKHAVAGLTLKLG